MRQLYYQVRQQQLHRPVEITDLTRFLARREKVLFLRNLGGLGDIFFHRMLFEDAKKLLAKGKIYFACPAQYHDAVSDHPFLDGLFDSKTVEENDFGVVYNTTRSCVTYELIHAPHCQKHRSDIWAEASGFTLTHHNMHFKITDQDRDEYRSCRQRLNLPENLVLIAPITAMTNKNLLPEQILPVARRLQDHGFQVAYLHHKALPEYGPTLAGMSIRGFLAAIEAAALVIAGDTAACHAAGGLGKPTVGVFSWADGKVYGKYYPNFHLVQKHRDDDPLWTCGPCYNFPLCPKTKERRKPCITEISAEQIWQKVVSCLGKEPGSIPLL